MASSARIDELKKKFDENPRRYFAPLANEYRKAGDPDQAIAICREFLPQQPGHMSGHIVYGQALYDAQQFEEARVVFDTALTLDPENLIALRQQGDIARQLGEFDSARSWYQRVLEADPRNEEIAAILTEIAAVAPPPPPAEPAPEPATGPQGTTIMAALQLDTEEPAAEPPAQPPLEPVREALVYEPPSEPVAEAVAAPPEAPAPPAEELLDIGELSIQTETPVVPRISTPRASLREMGVELERSDDETFAAEPESGAPTETPRIQPEEEPAVAGSMDALLETEDFELPPTPEPRAAAEPEAEPESAAETPASEARQDPFATLTMAELYLSQGHLDDALRVYRQLAAQKPDDFGLQAKVAELETQSAAAAAQEIPDLDTAALDFEMPPAPVEAAAAEPEAVPEPPAEPERAVAESAAASPGGPSIREFLSQLAARMPGGAGAIVEANGAASAAEVETPVPVPGVVEEAVYAAVSETVVEEAPALPEPQTAPTPPAELFSASTTPTGTIATGGSIDALFGAAGVSSLDQDAASTLAGAFGAVDGDEAGGTPATPISGAPARRATEELSLDSVFREPSGAPSQPAAGFSFDRFFSSGTPAAGSPATETPAQGNAPATPDDDIAQFNSWLEGLKKR